MAIKYISIKVGNRLHPYREYQLTAGSIRTELIDTKLQLVHLAEDNCEVLLHANDVRGDEALRNIILKKCRDLKWRIWLFTQDRDKHNNINEFKPYGDGIVYTWQELKNSFPNLPQNTIDDIHSLRSQILPPFVSLHLALQDSFDEKGKPKDNPLIFGEECKNCCANIKGLDGALEDFLKNVHAEHESEIKEKYNALKVKVDRLCGAIADKKTVELAEFKDLCEGGKNGNGLIGDFADMLEGVINRTDFKKKIVTLRHNIKNLLGTIDPNINALKNADKQVVREEWPIAKEAILRSGIDRVEKEIKLYDEIKGTIRKRNDIYEKLMEADKLYKVLFKAFSSNIEGDSTDSILKSGEALIQVLKDIIKKLEEMENA